MVNYVVRRLVMTVPLMLGVATLVFLLLHLVPGDPVIAMFRDSGGATAEQIQQVRHVLGLDRPLYIQYLNWMVKVLRGDLGQSITTGHDVTGLILSNMPSTIQLTVAGMSLAIAFGVFMGIIAALKHGTWIDNATMFVAVSGVAAPSFWLSMVLLYVFSVQLRWFPITQGTDLQRLVLPAAALGFEASAVIARLVRSSMLETMGQDYIRTAFAKGLVTPAVIIRHALRNSLIPVVTMVGMQFGWLLSGAVIIEFVFARRGIGQLVVEALRARDFPLAQGCILFIAVIYVMGNLAVDVLYGVIDPRISYQ